MKKKTKTKRPPLKLKDILPKVDWDDVAVELVSIHPKTRTELADYQRVFESLKKMESKLSEMQVVIEFAETKSVAEVPFFLAFGRKDPNDEGETLAFTPWDEWLGRDLVFEPPVWLPYARTVAVCLYDMTHYGFSEERIKEERQAMHEAIEEYVKKRQSGEINDWDDYDFPDFSMKDELKRLQKWLRWGGLAEEYFGMDENSFLGEFLNDGAPEYYDELDRWTLKAALREIAEDISWVVESL